MASGSATHTCASFLGTLVPEGREDAAVGTRFAWNVPRKAPWRSGIGLICKSVHTASWREGEYYRAITSGSGRDSASAGTYNIGV